MSNSFTKEQKLLLMCYQFRNGLGPYAYDQPATEEEIEELLNMVDEDGLKIDEHLYTYLVENGVINEDGTERNNQDLH